MSGRRGPVAAVEGTVMFTDIVGFTEFTALRGDAEALALLSTQERLVLRELGSKGRIVKELDSTGIPGITQVLISECKHPRYR